MCLAVPGRIVRITDEQGLHSADVDFGGVSRRICLVYAPEAVVGDYVIVHAGFAISILDQRAAARTLELIERLETSNIQDEEQ